MKSREKRAILIADLGYGDAGKGSIVDYVTRVTDAHTVIRYNGGAQAAHNVITPDGRHHTFAQFGSGMFIPGTRTFLSRFMMVHPLAILTEERHLRSLGVHGAFGRTYIDRGALITTPFQQAINRIKEIARGGARHGSCGMGIGETMSDWLTYGSDVLTAGDLADRGTVLKKLRFIRDVKISQLASMLRDAEPSDALKAETEMLYDPTLIHTTADIYNRFAAQVNIVDSSFPGELFEDGGTAIFEGAQGVLLDEWYGFFPYNSWSTLTFKNADALLSEIDFDGDILKLGLVRAYATRHGAGPFVTQDAELTTRVQDYHNTNNAWQREFRVGYLDFVALRYALNVTGKVDALVVTNLDRMDALVEWKTCDRYQVPGDRSDVGDFFEVQDHSVKNIRVPADPTDLTRQETLTHLLERMQPVYETCARDRTSYLEHISETLNLPIAITSAGPTAQEKESLSFFLEAIQAAE